MYIVSLAHSINYHNDLIGSKAMNLSKIKNVIPSIPDGFVITSDTFKEFLNNNSLDVFGKNIQEEIIISQFSDKIESEIVNAYAKLIKDNGYAVAVRSSSALEDLEGASFAGQYETILNVKNKEELLHSIKKCWASYFSSYVQDYASRNNVSLSDVKMGVFVQGMVNADVSGVIFSSNPVTNNQKEILINSSYGLGETVVDGTVTPDMFIINKESNQIIKELGEKEVKLIPTDQGNKMVDVPIEKQEEFSLNEEQVLKLTDITKKIEEYYQFPVDIEFAINNNKIFILQSRPITTLKGEKV